MFKRSLLVVGLAVLLHPHASRADDDAVPRGEQAVREIVSPLTGTTRAFDSLWKAWGLAKRPDDFAQRVRERYGLFAGDDESPYPLGLHKYGGPIGNGIAHNCLLCHAGRIAGKTVIGLGNASIDMQSLVEDLMARDLLPLGMPLPIGHGRGVTEASNGVSFLLSFRDKDFNLTLPPAKLPYADPLCQDMPAWWLLKHKRTMFHTGSTDARSLRSALTFLLAPIYTGSFVRAQEPMSLDMKQYILSLKSPAYPFPVDRELAESGKPIFRRHCSKCHGTYGQGGEYPNRIVPLDVIGTDPELSRRYSDVTDAEREYYAASWLSQETGPNGDPYHGLNLDGGYQAPPLHGVWATAPYFHNGSVPTIYHVLDSQSRPSVFTRSFETDVQDYDQQKLGWKIEVLRSAPTSEMPGHAKRRITDTAQPARGNGGHEFGDRLTDAERSAVIEYLKTL